MKNAQRCIRNKQFTEDEYHQHLQHIRKEFLSKPQHIKNKRTSFLNQFPRSALNLVQTENCFGNNLVASHHCTGCYNLKNAKNCKYWIFGDTGQDGVDLTVGGELSLCYEGIVPDHSYKTCFSIFCRSCTDVWYSEMCHSCQYCFGCVGLKNQQYCILNTQYTKEQYESLMAKILQSMQTSGDRGEFFPLQMSPFAYNHTIAQDYYPLTKQYCQKKSICRVDEEKEFNVSDTMKKVSGNLLPLDPHQVADEIVQQAIICEKSGRPFRILPQELQFYRKHTLPLPRLHPLERYRNRLQKMPAKNLYKRSCDKTGEQILSVYPQEVPFNVYTQQAYTQEVFG